MKYRVTSSIVYEVEGYDENEEYSDGPMTSGEAIDLVARNGYRHPAVRELWTQYQVQEILPLNTQAR